MSWLTHSIDHNVCLGVIDTGVPESESILSRCSPGSCPLAQVNVPVVLPDQAPMSVAILALQRSDTRLLSAALQLGPFIQEAAAQLSASRNAADAPAAGSSAASSPAKPLMNGKPARKQGPGAESATVTAPAGKEAGKSQLTRLSHV